MPDDEFQTFMLGLNKAQISNKLHTDKATDSHKESTKVYKEEATEVEELTRKLTKFEKAALKMDNISRKMKKSVVSGKAYGKKLNKYDYDDPSNRFARSRAGLFARGETSAARHDANFGADSGGSGGRQGKGSKPVDHPGLKSGWVGGLTKKLKKQADILHHVRRQWKLMTGAVIGSFYSIAKLSPLFASYISEFGGVLGYVYDTAIIPWTDAIEGLLDKLWEWGDWFDKAPEWVQKWVGALIIGIPILTGIAVAIASFGALLFWLSTSGFVAWIGSVIGGLIALFGGVSLITVGIVAVIAVLALFIAKWTGLDHIIINYIKGWITKFVDLWKNIARIAKAIYTIVSGEWKKMSDDNDSMLNKIVDKFTWVKEKVSGIITYLKDKWNNSFLGKVSNFSGTDWVADALESKAAGYDGNFATGATIVQDGLYKLHQGEKVTPATQVSSSSEKGSMVVNINPVITVEGGISNNIDIRDMADQLARFWQDDIRRLAGGSLR